MVEQYLAIKAEYPDTLLFYRMGDFYEMFFDDARIASGILDITLTSRNKNNEESVPMCGVPYHAADKYIARLIEHGRKVAICEQIEDPRQAKGLVKRDVVRVVTPGMLVDTELLDSKSNNFIMAISQDKIHIGIAVLDVSTGEFKVTETKSPAEMVDESNRIDPSEIIISASLKDNPEIKSYLSKKTVTILDDSLFEPGHARHMLLKQLGTTSLSGFGCDNMQAGVSAAGALLQYVHDTQKSMAAHIRRLSAYHLGDYMLLDDSTKRNLELFETIQSRSRQGSLVWAMDCTVTPMGGRLLRQWMNYPLLNSAKIKLRLDAVEETKDNMTARRSLRDVFSRISDLERIISKIVLGRCNARDLIALKESTKALPAIKDLLGQFQSDLLRQTYSGLDLLYDIGDIIEKSICDDPPHAVHDGGMIKSGYNARLDELTAICSDGKGWIARLETKEREATGINSLKVGFNKVFGYYIEISNAHIKSAPPHYVRKQTLVNAERYISEELKNYETTVLSAEEKKIDLEYSLFQDIREKIASSNQRIQNTATILATMDVVCALAETAALHGYVKPRISNEGILNIEDARHPVIEQMMPARRFVPNSINMDNESEQVLIITGPNMAGKSTLLRQAALVVLMAQIGSFVPAESASLPIVDRIFTRVGALDNLALGQSTFMVEMQETARILNTASEKSLIILDEIGRGTSTFDGLSIAWAVAEYLHDWKNMGIKTLFATHYHELTELASIKQRIKNYNVAVKERDGEIIFLRKLIKGGTNRSYGIQVAKLAGIPIDVITRAKEILINIEKEKLGVQGKPNMANPIQLNLFQPSYDLLIERLKAINVSNITPLEALNILNELKQIA
ncbi:MAG: DNA mismatch repair protein MutS [Pseudomonadota bacterium]